MLCAISQNNSENLCLEFEVVDDNGVEGIRCLNHSGIEVSVLQV